MKKKDDGKSGKSAGSGKGISVSVKKDSVGMARPTSKSTTHTPDPVVRKATVQGKEVASSRIDSARKANPALNKALGKEQTGRGGMAQYRDSKADMVNSALKREK